MNNKKHCAFFGALILIVLVIGGLIYQQEKILQEGDSIILATRPVDPRDLFRGEYLILRYEIENDEKIQTAIARENVKDGEELLIQLSIGENGVASVIAATAVDAINEPLEGLWIVGEVNRSGVRFPSLEQFYVPEGAGLPIERLGNDLHVKVVLRDGEARVTQLLDAELNVIDIESYLE
jgi:uncharacterized membrane-anchored protein